MKQIKILSGIGLAVIFGYSWAGSITGIKVDTIDNDKHVVKVTFDSAVPKPNSFSIANPPRIALDFPGTSVNLPSSQVSLNNELVQFATAVQGGSRTRVVLNLRRNANYTTEVKGNELFIRLNDYPSVVANNVMPTEETSTSAQTAAVPVSQQEANIQFHRGEKGVGRLEIALPDKGSVSPDIKREGNKVVIRLYGMQLPRAQQKKYNVSDFATPVSKVDVYNRNGIGQVVMESAGSWNYTSFQTDKKLVVEVSEKIETKDKNLTFDPADPNKNKKFSGQRLSLNFQDVSVREVLQVIAEFTGINIVTSDSVDGRITLRLKDVPWDQALALIMDTRDLEMRRNGNIIRIAPSSEIQGQENNRLKNQDELMKSGPLRTETFQLKYKSVEAFKSILKIESGGGSGSDSNSILTSRGSALIDPETNTLIITDTQPVIDKMRGLVEQLDVAARQVMIEARIVEADDGFERSLGVKFGGVYAKGGTSIANDYSNARENGNTVASGSSNSLMANPSVSLPASVEGLSSSIALFRRWSSGAIGLEISAMQIENKGKVISSPRILTQDRQEATIEDGTEIPYQNSTSSGATSVEFKKAVLSLKVKPQITPDNNIIMDLKVSKDAPTGTSGAMTVKRVTTRVMVENGGTVVIGGIYVQEENNTVDKVPLLGDIPVFGNLFKRRTNINKRRELLVFVTPRVMSAESAGDMRY